MCNNPPSVPTKPQSISNISVGSRSSGSFTQSLGTSSDRLVRNGYGPLTGNDHFEQLHFLYDRELSIPDDILSNEDMRYNTGHFINPKDAIFVTFLLLTIGAINLGFYI